MERSNPKSLVRLAAILVAASSIAAPGFASPPAASASRVAGSSAPLPREQVQGFVTAQLTPEWSIGAGFLRDLAAPQGGDKELRHGLNLAYEDECFLFTTELARSFTEDRDVRPTTSLMFRLTFKTLGRVQFSGL